MVNLDTGETMNGKHIFGAAKFRLRSIFLLTVLAMTLMAVGVEAQKVRLRSQITPNCGVGGIDKFSDIFADGNIAVQGGYNCRGAAIYNVSNPDAPTLHTWYNPIRPGTASTTEQFLEAIVVGNRGYFGSGNGGGVYVVDLTNPASPTLLGRVTSTNGNGHTSIHEMMVFNQGGATYLLENFNATSVKPLKIIDITNPAAAILKWEFSPVDNPWVHAFHIRGDRMYTSGWGGRLEIYDLANLANRAPVLLGSILGNSTNHSAWTSEDGNYLYSCRETLDGDLRVYDVRNPAQPVLVRAIKTSDLGLNAVSPHNPVVMGNYLYIAWYQAGIQVFDISDPTFPRHVAQYDTFQQTFAPPEEELEKLANPDPWDIVCGTTSGRNVLPSTYNGNWAVFPFLGQNKILAGDMANGLLVLDASALTQPLKNRVSDFDGDGLTDISSFTPQNGDWTIQYSTSSLTLSSNFGITGDIIVPGDFNGDGRVEQAIYRPSTGTWWFRNPTGTFIAIQFGLAEDIPVAADYDADGRTDIAVWRPSTSVWYILQSTLGLKIVKWGLSTDKPMSGDFEGDGKADIAVWRPSNGVWYVLQSSSNLPLYATWGTNGDKPLSADFDGNGRTDFAVFRPSNGTWYILDPAATPSVRGYNWGLADDMPIPADYDGDSKADVTVFRPSTNQWYRINSLNSTFDVRVFGLPGDTPSPSSVQPR